jgi:BRO1-like domain
MLAQGQLCFYEKAVKDRKSGSMKASIITKLATQTAVLYSEANKVCSEAGISRILDPSWKLHMEFQYRCMEGAAEYWYVECLLTMKSSLPSLTMLLCCLRMSVAAKEDAMAKASGYGQEIARLAKAEKILQKLISFAQTNRLSPEVCHTKLFLHNAPPSEAF